VEGLVPGGEAGVREDGGRVDTWRMFLVGIALNDARDKKGRSNVHN